MTPFPDYSKYDGLGLAELVRKKSTTPLELVDEAIGRIEAHNPRLNAVITKLYDMAREAAKNRLPEGPFTGVPFLIILFRFQDETNCVIFGSWQDPEQSIRIWWSRPNC